MTVTHLAGRDSPTSRDRPCCPQARGRVTRDLTAVTCRTCTRLVASRDPVVLARLRHALFKALPAEQDHLTRQGGDPADR